MVWGKRCDKGFVHLRLSVKIATMIEFHYTLNNSKYDNKQGFLERDHGLITIGTGTRASSR